LDNTGIQLYRFNNPPNPSRIMFEVYDVLDGETRVISIGELKLTHSAVITGEHSDRAKEIIKKALSNKISTQKMPAGELYTFCEEDGTLAFES
jgi:hypothetical protein